MTLELVQAEDVKLKKKSPKGEKYESYRKALEPLIPELKENIDESKDKSIRIRISEIKQRMGKEFSKEFIKKNDMTVYWGVKFVLFQEGIWVDSATHKDGSKILVMQMSEPDDILPPSLSKYLEVLENNEKEG